MPEGRENPDGKAKPKAKGTASSRGNPVVRGDYSGTLSTQPLFQKKSWKAVRIFWTNHEPDLFEPTSDLPHLLIPKQSDTVSVFSREVKVTLHDPYVDKRKGPATVRDLAQNYPPPTALFKDKLHKGWTEKVSRATPASDYTEAVDAATQKKYDSRHTARPHEPVGRIASAVVQWVLAEIEMEKPATAGSDSMPNLKVWAFLQPPQIGGNTALRAANNGYVTDDFPRAGWFSAEISGSTGYMRVRQFKEGREVMGEWTKKGVHFQVDAGNPRFVRVKFPVLVQNMMTPGDRKRLLEKRKEGPRPPAQFEYGSWLKVWVRNLDFDWGPSSEPKDDESEALVVKMRDRDPYPHPGPYNPKRHRNHSWRRDRLLDAEVWEKKGRRNLLYVGLLPKEVIDALNDLEREANLKRLREGGGSEGTGGRDKERGEIDWPGYITVFYAWLMLGWVLRKVSKDLTQTEQRKRAAQLVKKPAKDWAKVFFEWMEKMKLAETAAAYAVAGFIRPSKEGEGAGFRSPKEAMDLAKARFNKAHQVSKAVFTEVMGLYLVKDFRHYWESRKKASASTAAGGSEEAKPAGPERWSYGEVADALKAILEEVEDGEWEYGQVLKEAQKETEKRFPAFPRPLPYLPFLLYSAVFKASGGFKIGCKVSCKEEETKTGRRATYRLSITPELLGELFLTFDIHAFWGILKEEIGKGPEGQGLGEAYREWHEKFGLNQAGFLFKDSLTSLVEMVDIHFYGGLQGKAEALLDFGLEWEFEAEGKGAGEGPWKYRHHRFSWKGSKAEVDLNLPIFGQLMIFSWDYRVFEGELLRAKSRSGSFFPRLRWLGEVIPNTRRDIIWGEGKFARDCTVVPNRIVIGQPFEVSLLFQGLENPGIQGGIEFASQVAMNSRLEDKENKGGATTALVKDLSCIIEPLPPSDVLSPSTRGKVDFTHRARFKTRLSWWMPRVTDKDFISLYENTAGHQLLKSLAGKPSYAFQPKMEPEEEPDSPGEASLLHPIFGSAMRFSQQVGTSLQWRVSFRQYLDDWVWVRLLRHVPGQGLDKVEVKGNSWNLYRLVALKKKGQNMEGALILPLKDITRLTIRDTQKFPLRENEEFSLFPIFSFLNDNACLFQGQKPLTPKENHQAHFVTGKQIKAHNPNLGIG